MNTRANIVLIHGAWAEGSCWGGVIERLQQTGFALGVATLGTLFISTEPHHIAGGFGLVVGISAAIPAAASVGKHLRSSSAQTGRGDGARPGTAAGPRPLAIQLFRFDATSGM